MASLAVRGCRTAFPRAGGGCSCSRPTAPACVHRPTWPASRPHCLGRGHVRIAADPLASRQVESAMLRPRDAPSRPACVSRSPPAASTAAPASARPRRPSTSCASRANPSKARRMSVGPAANQTRTPAASRSRLQRRRETCDRGSIRRHRDPRHPAVAQRHFDRSGCDVGQGW